MAALPARFLCGFHAQRRNHLEPLESRNEGSNLSAAVRKRFADWGNTVLTSWAWSIRNFPSDPIVAAAVVVVAVMITPPVVVTFTWGLPHVRHWSKSLRHLFL